MYQSARRVEGSQQEGKGDIMTEGLKERGCLWVCGKSWSCRMVFRMILVLGSSEKSAGGINTLISAPSSLLGVAPIGTTRNQTARDPMVIVHKGKFLA